MLATRPSRREESLVYLTLFIKAWSTTGKTWKRSGIIVFMKNSKWLLKNTQCYSLKPLWTLCRIDRKWPRSCLKPLMSLPFMSVNRQYVLSILQAGPMELYWMQGRVYVMLSLFMKAILYLTLLWEVHWLETLSLIIWINSCTM